MLFQKKGMALGKRGMTLEKRAWRGAMLKLTRGKAIGTELSVRTSHSSQRMYDTLSTQPFRGKRFLSKCHFVERPLFRNMIC